MAVQKSKVSRSARGMRRSHDKVTAATLSVDMTTGEMHRRHHITKNGYYRGNQVIKPKPVAEEVESSEESL